MQLSITLKKILILMAVKVFCATSCGEQWGIIQSPAADYFFRRIGATDQDRGIGPRQTGGAFRLFMVIP